MNKDIIFIDVEVDVSEHKAYDYGAVTPDGNKLHVNSREKFHEFIADCDFICGHNIINHDSNYIDVPENANFIDTLYLSPLLFPNKPYHALVKDEKLLNDELNNPLSDSIKAMELYFDEENAFRELPSEQQFIYYALLRNSIYFSGFFKKLNYASSGDAGLAIRDFFEGKICSNSPIGKLVMEHPIELAYCLALISAEDVHSIIPKWVTMTYPYVTNVMHILRHTPCMECGYCRNALDPINALGKYFGYTEFRTYNGEPLQEMAVRAAVSDKSLLAIFPTGGGKSLTFQIPALMAGENKRALTVVISPLQSLMKDQVDNLERRGIAESVTINGLLSPIERADAIERVESGLASILYISPESLRSVTIEKLFMSRTIERFVIDEAHCFSAWGQDFRVDYLYIGDFIKELEEKKGEGCKIPVSCFTATAKQKVISDIKEYFKEKLDIELELYTTNASRTNLRYEVLYQEDDGEKYDTLRRLIEQKNCPTIVYASRTKRTVEIAEKLCSDGFRARAFHGKMDSNEKQANQEAFINDDVQIIVATSAFGMGVDKSNVGLVIHYNISDSLENYVQEAGRAGRDQTLNADCYVLYSDNDLDKHFMLLNQTKLSINEIQQVWKSIKYFTKSRPEVSCSPLEIARQSGWDESKRDIETRVKTAILALENAGYIKRGKNSPKIYADSILVKNMAEASVIINKSQRFENDTERTNARRIISSLISEKAISKTRNDDAESRVDYIADRLGIQKADVIAAISNMREEGILANAKDLTAYISRTDTANKALIALKRFEATENFLLSNLNKREINTNYRELNDFAIKNGIKNCTVKSIKTIFYYWTMKGYIQREQNALTDRVTVVLKLEIDKLREVRKKCYEIASVIIKYLFDISGKANNKDEAPVQFSVLELKTEYKSRTGVDIKIKYIEDALLFLSKIGAMRLEDGFLVIYNAMKITRLELDNKKRYKVDDYRQLDTFYQQKIQQIHIVGEYANMMVRDYDAALKFVNDYFSMDYKKFINTYFEGERAKEIERNITPERFERIFGTLSERQLAIINDKVSKNIVVAAGPGSGKTRVLVHKLASLLIMENVKSEQLLMLTFSRAAAIEFKQRLCDLIGTSAAHFVEVKTFHSYCFDIIGKIGNLDESKNVVEDAVKMIKNGEVDLGKITKTVLVIDEAQDMDSCEYALVETLMEQNEDLRVIAVGDDDQNIYEFRGSNSKHMNMLLTNHNAMMYTLIDNYRSCGNVVRFANRFISSVSGRMKTEEILSARESVGKVRLIKHIGADMETAVINDIIASDYSGSICVLTETNKESMMALGVLRQKKIPAKLIQGNDGFDISNLAEIRYFIKHLKHPDSNDYSPVISDEIWEKAIEELSQKYAASGCLDFVLDVLKSFSDLNEKKYRTDFSLFLHESKFEDFYKDEKDVITVSTMHKSKGREFDNVFLILGKNSLADDAAKRAAYVAVTRAKDNLHIHYSCNEMDAFADYSDEYIIDKNRYVKPDQLIMQLSHKDVNLGFFKDKKRIILERLKSGMHLVMKNDYMYINANEKAVLKLSKDCSAQVRNLTSQGYVPTDAVIRYICAWKGDDDDEETAIILPDIIFNRK